MEDKTAILVPKGMYHIYNRANGNERLFKKEGNFHYFLDKYKQYISPIADTFCYCLMPNHFHFLIRIKSEEQLLIGLNQTGFENLSGLLSKKFSDFFNAYSKAFNKQENRKGALFMRPFKRKIITDEKYLLKLVHYIHFNPVEAKLVSSPEEWKYSSFSPIINEEKPDLLLKDEVIGWFNDIENFIYCHGFPAKESGIEI